jgi:hypothetical protein
MPLRASGVARGVHGPVDAAKRRPWIDWECFEV